MRRIGPLLLMVAVAGCAAWPSGSYERVSDRQAPVLARSIADYLGGALSLGATVTVLPASAKDPIAPLLRADLANEGISPGTAHSVSYIAAPMDAGILLRVSLDKDQGASQYFAIASDGSISPGGPMMVARQ